MRLLLFVGCTVDRLPPLLCCVTLLAGTSLSHSLERFVTLDAALIPVTPEGDRLWENVG